MFRDRMISSPHIIQRFTGKLDTDFTPKIDDTAELIIEENNIRVNVRIKNLENEKCDGEIVSYHAEMKKLTPTERLDEIKTQEEYINTNNLTNGSVLSFTEKKIFCLHRGQF